MLRRPRTTTFAFVAKLTQTANRMQAFSSRRSLLGVAVPVARRSWSRQHRNPRDYSDALGCAPMGRRLTEERIRRALDAFCPIGGLAAVLSLPGDGSTRPLA